MFATTLGAPEALIVLVVILVLFGGSQIPKMARNLGQAQREFKKGLSDGQKSGDQTEPKAADTKDADTERQS